MPASGASDSKATCSCGCRSRCNAS